MFRTRDFILIFTAIVFFLVAIGSTVLYQRAAITPASVDSVTLVMTEDREYIAEVYVPEKISREDRLAEMRIMIAESGSLSISSPEEIEIDGKSVEIPKKIVMTEVQLCSNYSIFQGVWPTGIEMDVVEGARIIYTETLEEVEIPPLTPSSTSTVRVDVVRNVLVQLPVSFGPKGSISCLSSDVIGVAKDGSLVRNAEAGLYGVFSSDTLIGYALDGFPIRGTTADSLDSCGGQTVGGQYGYYIPSDKTDILNCFSGTPTNI